MTNTLHTSRCHALAMAVELINHAPGHQSTMPTSDAIDRERSRRSVQAVQIASLFEEYLETGLLAPTRIGKL